MKETLADHAKDWATLMLAGLGISFAPHEWVGGMFLALAGATFAMRSDPEQDMRELWLVLLGAFLASHIAAMVAHKWAPGVPVQIVMACSGYFSRRLTRLTLRLGGLVEERGEKITDRIIDRILPGRGKDDE